MLLYNQTIKAGNWAGVLALHIGGTPSDLPEKDELEIIFHHITKTECPMVVLDLTECRSNPEWGQTLTVAVREIVAKLRREGRILVLAVIHSYSTGYRWLSPQPEPYALHLIHHIESYNLAGIPANEVWIILRTGDPLNVDTLPMGATYYVDPEQPADVLHLLKSGIRLLAAPKRSLVQYLWPERSGGTLEKGEPALEEDPVRAARRARIEARKRELDEVSKKG